MGGRVLVVDDSAMVRGQVARSLRAAGFEVDEAFDGIDALEKIAEAGPALIICDINMPRMSGIELLEHLGLEGTTRTPVVVLTTEGQPELIKRAKELGAKGWIIKPFKADLLVAVARKLAA
jgi:two-component system chemotaxis response regulator CheY